MAGTTLSPAARPVSGATLTVRAPGRVNLIGEHTDYNDGFVMPIAIDRYTSVTATARNDLRLRVSSAGFGTGVDIDLQATAVPATVADQAGWSQYVGAVARALQDAGHRLRGADLHIESSVPVGAGLSSSAALEVACGYALLRLAGVQPELTALAKCCQRAENEYVGAQCGIMDQFIACHAQAGSALLLDCRDLEFRQLPLKFGDTDTRIVVCNSMVRHSLATGAYNERRAQCEAGVKILAVRDRGIRALRDVTLAQLSAGAAELEPLLLRRCRHVVSENERVSAGAAAIERGDAAGFGALMYASHTSMRLDFAVTCAEIDLLVEIASHQHGVYGARMTGGGFGGCTVNLVRTDSVAAFEAALVREYCAATGRTPEVFVCRASAGVSAEHAREKAGG